MGLFDFFKKEDSVKKRNFQHLANLFSVALSDGELSDSEQEKINEIREDLGITESEYKGLVKDILDGTFSKTKFISPNSDEEAWDQLKELAHLALADERIDDNEIKVIKILSKSLGFGEDNEIIRMLIEAQDDLNNSNDT